MSLSPRARLGPYEIVAPLGAGGMGEVYRARDTRLDREVAIKVLPSELSSDADRLKRFEKEARSASSLNHPNIVTIYEVERVDSTSFIVMELVEGKTLREVIADGPFPIRRLLGIGVQIAEGLARAHASGITHRDLKPENVMVGKDGLVKILDFGLAKLARPDLEGGQPTQTPTVSTGTRPGIVMGTVGYMSPEQASGHPVDFRSDQFSLGSILYEMLTGRRAFARATAAETLTAIIREDPESIGTANPKTPIPLRWIVERCLAKDPRERYAATEDLARDLATVRDRLSEATTSGAALMVEAPRRWASRWALPSALALLAIVGIAVALSLRSRDEPPLYHRVTFRRGAVFGARFAPDGQTIVYGSAWEGKPVQLFLTRSDSTESTLLPLPNANILSISPSGKMAILLFKDPQTLAEVSLAGGAPREILEDPAWLSADWSPEGQNLVVARPGRLEYPIGKVLYQGAVGPPTGPRFSPDGKSIAFVEGGIYEEQAIAVVDLAGKKRSLTRGLEYTLGLAWHPKTGEIWFSAREHAGGYGGLVLFALSPTGRRRVVGRVPGSLIVCDISRDGRVLLTSSEFRKSMMCLSSASDKEVDLSWLDFSQIKDLSDDGTVILFDEAGAFTGKNAGVYLRKTDGSPAVRLGEGSAVALSADGKWVISIPPEGDRLVLLPTGAGERKELRSRGVSYTGARWFPDGKRILVSASAGGRPARLYLQDATAQAPRPLTPEGFDIGPVSPDGKLVATRGPGGQVVLYPVDGGEPRAVPGIEAEEKIVRWDATGQALFLAKGIMPVRIERLVLSTGRREPWKEIALADPSGIIESDVRLTPDGKSYVYSYLRDTDYLYVVDGLR